MKGKANDGPTQRLGGGVEYSFGPGPPDVFFLVPAVWSLRFQGAPDILEFLRVLARLRIYFWPDERASGPT